MSGSAVRLPNLVSPARLKEAAVATAPWSLEDLDGRLVEISGLEAQAALTLAFGLVLEAQRQGEPVGWVTPRERSFYPPDAAGGGVDLDALVVVRVPEVRAVARAADRLARSGAFGLIVLDTGAAVIPIPLQARLAGLAEKHRTVLVCLSEKTGETRSLGSLVSVRVHARRAQTADGRFACKLLVTKDKRRGPTWTHAEVCDGPAGVR